jgi:hypothetical protein
MPQSHMVHKTPIERLTWATSFTKQLRKIRNKLSFHEGYPNIDIFEPHTENKNIFFEILKVTLKALKNAHLR